MKVLTLIAGYPTSTALRAMFAGAAMSFATFGAAEPALAGPGPIAENDSYSTPENTTLDVTAPGVLGNDVGFALPLTAVLDSGTANGSLALNANGSFTYVPSLNFFGLDMFTYHDVDAVGGTDIPATVDINVVPTTSVDAPPSLPLLIGGLGAMALLGWRRKRSILSAIAARALT